MSRYGGVRLLSAYTVLMVLFGIWAWSQWFEVRRLCNELGGAYMMGLMDWRCVEVGAVLFQ